VSARRRSAGRETNQAVTGLASEKGIARWLTDHILPLGAPGIFLVALADSGIMPMPESVDLLLFAQIVRHPRGFLLYAALATAGSLLGCMFLYYISRKAGEIALERHTTPQRIAHMRRRFEKYEALTVVLPAMVPVPLPMKVFVIAAGAFKVRFGLFVVSILFARVVRYFTIAFVAYRYGDQTWAFLRHNAIFAGLAAAALIAAFYWLSRRLR
jgi:membrane protein YqaA with SNARE-associated domain